MNKRKGIILGVSGGLGIVITAIILVIVFRGKQETDPEKIFTKTIHDFPGRIVENLDENEDTNFIVYAEDVVEIQETAGQNIVVSADYENNIYIFENASTELLNLQEGSVFFVDGSETHPEGIAAKIKSIEVKDNTTTVIGDEVFLEDLYEYIDIDMNVPYSTIYYDPAELEEGSEIRLMNEEELNAITASTDAYTASPVNLSSLSGDSSVTQPLSLVFSKKVQLMGDSSGLGAEFNWRFILKAVHVEYKYSIIPLYFHAGISFDCIEYDDVRIKVEGRKKILDFSFPSVIIPIGTSPLVVKVTPSITAEAKGSVNGIMSTSKSFGKGFSATATLTGGIKGGYQNVDKGTSNDLTISVEGSLEILGKLTASLGIPGVADVYGAIGVGAEFAGTLDNVLTQTPNDAAATAQGELKDEVHDCAQCVDGDILAVGNITVGASIPILALKDSSKFLPEIELLKVSAKVGDFYASYRDSSHTPGNEGSFEAGLGECPYKRYRTTIIVKDNSGDLVPYADVSAKYPDDRKDSTTTNENGTATLYLPSGKNELKGTYGGRAGSTVASVDKQPASATILLLDYDKKIYIDYSVEILGNPDLELDVEYLYPIEGDAFLEYLQEELPDAIICRDFDPATQYEIHPGDIIINLSVERGKGYLQYYPRTDHGLDKVYSWGGYQDFDLEATVCLYQKDEDEPVFVNFYSLSYQRNINNSHYVSRPYRWERSPGYIVDSEYPNFTILTDLSYTIIESYRRRLKFDHDYILEEYGGLLSVLPGYSVWESLELYDEDVIEYCRNRDTYDMEYMTRFVEEALPYIEKMLTDDWDFEQPDEGLEQPGEEIEVNGE